MEQEVGYASSGSALRSLKTHRPARARLEEFDFNAFVLPLLEKKLKNQHSQVLLQLYLVNLGSPTNGIAYFSLVLWCLRSFYARSPDPGSSVSGLPPPHPKQKNIAYFMQNITEINNDK